MQKHSFFGAAVAMALASCAATLRMSDDAPALSEPAEAAQQDQAPTVTLDVPTDHLGLFQRIVTLIESGEQWVLDNIHAGVTTLEGMLQPGDTPD